MAGAKKKGPVRKRTTKNMRVGGMTMPKKMRGGGMTKKKGPARRGR